MPFANINFSELIKAAISLSLTLFLSLSRIHENENENDDVDVDDRHRHRHRHRYRYCRRRRRLLDVGITRPRNARGYTLPPTRYMLAVMLLASCVDPRAKLAFSWLPWPSWYSAGIGIKTSSSSATCVTIPRSLPPIAALAPLSLALSNYLRLSRSALSLSLVRSFVRSFVQASMYSDSFSRARYECHRVHFLRAEPGGLSSSSPLPLSPSHGAAFPCAPN